MNKERIAQCEDVEINKLNILHATRRIKKSIDKISK